MLGGARWLTLEVKHLDRARSFYESALDLSVASEAQDCVAFAVGDGQLRLQAPGAVPRGGLHTHYAMTVARSAYDDWYDRLGERFDLTQYRFGDARSLYFYDTEGNCVELGERDRSGAGVGDIFEIVLEVEDLQSVVAFYERLGFDVVDRGANRKRVRLTTGELDIELWEPHLGLADARGGVHVDWAIAADEPSTVADRVVDDALAVEETADGVRVRDPDGHYLTLVA
jgi:catechol 2,3-dioxygenase-like lactoylglutathione lyase family enzyme